MKQFTFNYYLLNYKILLLIILFPLMSISQKFELSNFENLTGKTWKAEGKWGDGTKFIQKINFEYSLDSTLIICDTKGLINDKSSKLKPRGHGIRQYDKNSNSIKFWEFDRNGGLTRGSVSFDKKNIIYQYKYKEAILTDMWEYVNDSTYNYKVGNYMNNVWIQTYLETEFKEIKED